MATNLSVDPYFDDFNDQKEYYQILFKPGQAVQARELTQLQSILRDQVKKFGDHVFKHGSIVIPGNSTSDLSVPFVRCQASTAVTEDLVGRIVSNAVGVRAIIKAVEVASGADPLTFYLAYIGGGTNGTITFADGDILSVEGDGREFTAAETTSTGLGALASVNDGVYYINGTFAVVKKQTIVIGKYTNTPSVHVLLRIDESIVDSDEDPTLLDPSQGTFNFAAPGADRLRITLTLTTLPIGAAIDQNYVEIMRIRDGIVEEHAKTPRYSELEKNLARRTFDESGNYVVEGLIPTIRESRRIGFNDGVSSTGDANKLTVEVSSGKAYIQGFEVEKVSSTRLEIDKARTVDHQKQKTAIIRPEYGQHLYVSGVVESFSIFDRQTIQLWNDDDRTNASATQIGSARVLGIDYHAGLPGSTGVYKLWISDLTLNAGRSIDEVGGIRYGSAGRMTVLNEYIIPLASGTFNTNDVIVHSSGRTATVQFWDAQTSRLYAFKHLHTQNAPRVGDLVSVGTVNGTINARQVLVSFGQASMVFRLPSTSAFSLRDAVSSNFELEYTVQKELLITTNGSGSGSVVIPSGTILPIEVGTFVAVGPSGLLSNSLFSLNVSGNTLTITGGPASSTVRAYCAVRKQNVSPKTKTLTNRTQVFTAPGNATLQLDRADIVRVVSVIDTVGDITANYRLWNGQTDFSYQRGSLSLVSGRSAPVGDVTVVYEFFEHSISGDFFCADSYASVPDYLERNFVFNSRNTGQIYDLVNSVDFRPTVGNDGLFTSASARRNDAVLESTVFRTELRYFVPRIDVLTVDPKGVLEVIRGRPDENAQEPVVPEGKFALNALFLPAYTRRTTDVISSRKDVERYTMQDITNIVRRVERIEEFATLTADEQSLANFEVVDAATGLTRFKTGFLVENFVNPLVVADTTNAEFRCNLDREQLTAPLEVQSCDVVLRSDSTHYQIKDQFVTLPYTEEVFASQMMSSRVTNLNPFLVIRWEGVLNVFPRADNWVEVINNPSIFRDVVELITVQRWQTPWNTSVFFRQLPPVLINQSQWVAPAPPSPPVQLPPAPPPVVNPPRRERNGGGFNGRVGAGTRGGARGNTR